MLAEGADANATVITNLADPVAAQDAATKAYVDANSAGHTGTPNSIFFADNPGGIPTDAGNQFFWDPNGRDFGVGTTGALYVGTDGNPQSDITKVHIGEALNGEVSYPLQLQNYTNSQGNQSSVGLLFSVEATSSYGKGALVYERNAGFARGDFHFLQDAAGDQNNADINDAVVTIKNDGFMGVGTTNPQNKFHVTGAIRSEGILNSEGTEGEPSYRFSTNNDTDTGMYRAAEDQLGFSTGGTEGMRIYSTQTVRIGPDDSTIPESTLEVNGSLAMPIDTNVFLLDGSNFTTLVSTPAAVITLPVANTASGRIYIIKNISGGNITTTLNYLDSVGTSVNTIAVGVVQLQSDGTNWQQIN